MERALSVLCSLLMFLLDTSITQSVHLETLLLTRNNSEVSTVKFLQEALIEKGVDLKLTNIEINVSEPFASVRDAYANQWPTIKLVLLSPSLCNSESISFLLIGLSAPHICYIESTIEKITWIIYKYSLNCLVKEVDVSALRECQETEQLQSTLTIEDVLGMLITSLHSASVIIFFENNMDSLATSVSTELSRESVQCLMYRLTSNQTDEDITNLISHVISLVPVSGRNFLLLCDGSTARRILRKANEFSDRTTAMRMMSSWLLLLSTEDFCNFQDPDLALDNVAAVNMSSDMFSYRTSTSICFSEAIVTTLLYKPTFREWNSVAFVNSSGHLVLQQTIFPNQYFGFNKKKLIVATMEMSPFSMKRMSTYEGISIDLLQELAALFNFTYDIIQPDDMEWGRVVNGSWTGVVGLLNRTEVDISVAPLTVTQERESVMDFIYPYYYDVATALYKFPDKKSSKWLTLMWPFQWEVFLCLGVVFLSTGLLLCSVEYLSSDREKKSKFIGVISYTMWHIAGAFLMHGSYKHLNSHSGRVLVIFLWFFCIIIVATYSGNLTAFLTVTKTNPPFRTLAQVAQQDEYTWGTDGGSMWTTLFKTSNRSDYQMIWKGILSHNKTKPGVLSASLDQHRRFVKKGSYLFFFDRDVISVWAQDNCDLVLLEETFYQITYAVGLPQNSPYGLMFSETMLQIEQSGLLQIWKAKWWPRDSTCTGKMTVQAEVIELIDLQSGFYLLGIGLVTAVLVFLSERLQYPQSLCDKLQTRAL